MNEEDSVSMFKDRLSWIMDRIKKIDDEALREFIEYVIIFEYRNKDSGISRYSKFYNDKLDEIVKKNVKEEGDIT
jgi:hypothetical protein